MRYLITSSIVLIIFSVFTYSQTRTYTLDADFDEGTLVNVNHDSPNNDQLQLSAENVILPFIWVPNDNGTVSKVNTETGNELGRYKVAPHSNCSPSRTTVDLQGNCWVGNREAGTVVKIGLYEAGQYIDRNGNGTIETSQDLNNDGDITGAEILPWGQDECVLYEVVLIPGKEGTFVPGTYAAGYDFNYWGTAPRGLAIDANNNLWAGTWSSSKYYYIDGATGTILSSLDVSPYGHSAYGAVIDGNGVLWSAFLGTHILRIDPSVSPPNVQIINLGHTYGLGLDYQGYLFVGGGGQLTKIDVNDTVTPIVWTKSARTVRGVVCTSDNNVWVAGTDASNNYNAVSRYDNNGNLIITIGGFNAPSGVAVDAVGKVWVTDISTTNIYRIVPATNTVDLTKGIIGSGGHYTYSDMTGILSRTITTKIGTWNVIYDSGLNNLPWGTISWNSNEPTGTSITVEVRSSNDLTNWSSWETSTNGIPLSSTSDGRYLEVRVTFQIVSGDVSPILYDLTVQSSQLFPYMTMWAVNDHTDGKLQYYTLDVSSAFLNIEGDILGIEGPKDLEDLIIDGSPTNNGFLPNDGTFYIVNNVGTSTIYKLDYSEFDDNPATPVNATLVGSTGLPADPGGSSPGEISSLLIYNYKLYGLSKRTKKLYEISTADGSLTQVFTLNVTGDFRTDGMTYRPDDNSNTFGPTSGGTVYLLKTNDSGGESEIWKFDTFPSGDISYVRQIETSGKVEALSAHPDGYLYASDQTALYQISVTSSDIGYLADYTVDIEGMDYFYEFEVFCPKVPTRAFIPIAPTPVELVSFTAEANGSSVILNWETATEVNNYGFDILRRAQNDEWVTLGFVDGHGNSNSPKSYSFTDNNPTGGSVFRYRLKQIDNDGSYVYSEIVEVEFVPTEFALYQNYPNPFNPTTKIKYSILKESNVTLKVFDILGNEVMTLVSGKQEAGTYEIEFGGSNLVSGIYVYQMQAGAFSNTKKMLLMK